jgi:hypothetical protein
MTAEQAHQRDPGRGREHQDQTAAAPCECDAADDRERVDDARRHRDARDAANRLRGAISISARSRGADVAGSHLA